mgnify:CR=1 FL=1
MGQQAKAEDPSASSGFFISGSQVELARTWLDEIKKSRIEDSAFCVAWAADLRRSMPRERHNPSGVHILGSQVELARTWLDEIKKSRIEDSAFCVAWAADLMGTSDPEESGELILV